MMSQLNKLYKEILEYLGFSVNSEGMIDFVVSKDRTDPAMFSGSRIVLPTQENIKKDNTGKQMLFFSPFSESMFVDETDAMGLLRLYVNSRLNTLFSGLCVMLVSLAQTKELHDSLNSDQQKYLFKLGEHVDEHTLQDFMKILNKSKKNQPERFFLNIYVQKGGKKDDTKYRRLASMNFNFLKELESKKGKELGISERSRKVFLALYSILTEGITSCVGSHSEIAAYSETLLMLASGYTQHWNNIINTFKSIDDSIPFSSYLVDHTWMDTIQNRDEIYKELRILPDLEGNTTNRDKPVAQQQAIQQPVKEIPAWTPAPSTQPQQQSVVTQPVLQQPVLQPPQQPVLTQPVLHQPMLQAPQQSVMVQQPQQQSQAAAGTVSFASILSNPAVNPAVAANTMGMYPNMMYNMQQTMPMVAPNGQIIYGNQQPMMMPMVQQPMVQQPQLIQTPQGLAQVVNTAQGQVLMPVNGSNLNSQLAQTPIQTNPALPPIPLHFLMK